MSNFSFSKGDHISSDIAWLPPTLETFYKFCQNVIEPKNITSHEIYIYGSFPHRPTNSIDLAFIGRPTDQIALEIIDLYNVALNDYRILVDITLFENYDVFKNIDEYNKNFDITTLNFVTAYKPYYEIYKNGEAVHKERQVEKISKYLYKYNSKNSIFSEKFIGRKIYNPMNIKQYLTTYKAYDVQPDN